jgi:hypothetical protein
LTGQLQSDDGGGGSDERCVHCGALAAGPCARCALPVCGDCCVLTTGGIRVYAVCNACEQRGAGSLRRGWLAVLVWVAVPLVLLAAAVALLAALLR